MVHPARLSTVFFALLILLSACDTGPKNNSDLTPEVKEPEKIKAIPDGQPQTSTGFKIPKGEPGNAVIAEGSRFTWRCKNVIGTSHEGTFDLKRGKIGFNEQSLPINGLLIFDLSSAAPSEVDEETFGSGAAKRLTDHLHSKDFLYTTKYDQAFLLINSIEPARQENQYVGFGELTIKDITKAVNIRFDLQKEAAGYVISSDYAFDRTEWGITYNSGKFFEDLGDEMIDDIVEISGRFAVNKK